MVRSRRPELEKDNPIAPQPYLGPRRRLALSRRASSTPAAPSGGMEATLRTLMEAAEQFVNGVPYIPMMGKERNALLEAITEAQVLLSANEHLPAKRTTGAAKKR